MRELERGPPWDYKTLVREAAAGKRQVLDMGTGGGELLADLREALGERVVATEEWVVNAPVAYRRLRPAGVDVVRCSSLRLPFLDSSFELVINRHEELDPAEVARVLRPGGFLLTQQVGLHNNHELRAFFPRMNDFGDIFAQYANELRALDFEVEGTHHDFKVAYGSLGDFVYLLGITPWTIPDFSVERDLEALLAFEGDRLTEDGIVVTECRFLLTALKPT
jgi:SAM-dependent methyltransferase